MGNANVAYFFKKFCPNVIKWWYVDYNPSVQRIWPSESEKEAALQEEAESVYTPSDSGTFEDYSMNDPDASAFNAATGSYSGLYGQGPVDDATQSLLDQINNNTSSAQDAIDSMLNPSTVPEQSDTVELPEDQEEILKEANAIYERLLREAAEDEAKKQAEVDAAYAAQES